MPSLLTFVRLRRIPTRTLHALFRSARRANCTVHRVRHLLCLVNTRRNEPSRIRIQRRTKRQTWCIIALGVTGAVENLQGSLLCNPWNVSGMADAIYDALAMDKQQRAINRKK
jgi:trehalose-6-phosphate synthase